MSTLVHEALFQRAQSSPDKVAVVTTEGSLTYAELADRAGRLAGWLRAHGVEAGDRVALFLDNSLAACVGIYGALAAGAAFVPINPTTKSDRLQHVLDDCEPACLLTHARFARVLGDVLTQRPWRAGPLVEGGAQVGTPLEDVLGDARLERPAEAAGADHLATLIYTSGSTGRPKGVMMPHTSVVAAVSSITEYLENREDDVVLNVLPLSFDYGLYQLLMTVSFGGRLVLEKGFLYLQDTLDLLARERVTGFPIVPTILAMLFAREDAASLSFPELRYVTNTGAALPVATIQRLRELWPDTRVYSMYGLTECKRVSYLPPSEVDRRPGSVGVAMSCCEAFVVGDDGQRLPPGEVGELVVRGRNVMLGYWNRPEESARIVRETDEPGVRELSTGDLFRTDDEGFLYFVARRDDIIKSRGEKVSPKEVEEVLHRAPGVAEAAVVGADDRLLGEAVVAFVVPAAGEEIKARSVTRHCAQHLESHAVPTRVELVPELPRSANGKIDKKALRARASAPEDGAR